MTIVLTAVFAYLAVTGVISAQEFMTIFTVVISFYFGTQYEKRVAGNTAPVDTCDAAIDAARGKVVTFGLGLGYYAYMVSEKAEVRKIVVVEKSADVIELFKKFILPQFPRKEKVEIVNEDAFYYAEHIMPGEKFDVAFVDTWRDASDGAPMYRRMKPLEKLNPNTEFLYWIENFLISRVRAENYGKLLDMEERGEFELTAEQIKSYLDRLD